MFQNVFEALQNNQFLEAESLLKKMVIANPGSPDVLHLMGVVCGMQGRPFDALAFFEKALQITPDNPALLFNAAKALSTLQRDTEALEYHRRAISLDPEILISGLITAGA